MSILDTPAESFNVKNGWQLIDKEQLSQLLHVSPTTVERLKAKGMPCVRIMTTVRYRPDEVMRYLDQANAKGSSHGQE